MSEALFDFLNELGEHTSGTLRTDEYSRILYSTDASMYQIEPLGVAIPRTQDDLQSAVELAAKYAVPILPRGAGSSLGGQAVGEALILDCSRWLDSIIDIDPESRTATVEPGVVLSTLNSASAQYGLTFGPDPASAERAPTWAAWPAFRWASRFSAVRPIPRSTLQGRIDCQGESENA